MSLKIVQENAPNYVAQFTRGRLLPPPHQISVRCFPRQKKEDTIFSSQCQVSACVARTAVKDTRHTSFLPLPSVSYSKQLPKLREVCLVRGQNVEQGFLFYCCAVTFHC